MKLKKTARCPRCGRPLIMTGKHTIGKRVMYEYLHNNRSVHTHYEYIWLKDAKYYETGVYGKLFKNSKDSNSTRARHAHVGRSAPKVL